MNRGHVLVARLDNAGDVLLAGPAVRAVAGRAQRLTLLAGPHGRAAAAILPGVDAVLDFDAPWVPFDAAAVSRAEILRFVARVEAAGVDEAVILTSFHQSPLPAALLLRLAGVGRIGAASEDYPGSLLDVRLVPPPELHEVERALAIAAACGFELPPGDDRRLRVRLPPGDDPAPAGAFVVLHPGTSVPARAWSPDGYAALARALTRDGHRVVVTGAAAERGLTARVAGIAPGVIDLGGRTSLAELARVLSRAAALVCGNTGPAHLAAAVGTPVVSLFAPTVPARQWRPWGTPTVLLGDQSAPCAGSRARRCPVPGHPCLGRVEVATVQAAVHELAGASLARAASR